MRRSLTLLLLLAGCVLPDSAAKFVPLFNGTDLEGWHAVNCAEETWITRDGMIVCSGIPTGVLRTDRMYENFILEMQYRHVVPKGNAGLFIWSDPLPAVGVPFTRSIEVQVMDGIETDNYTSHGDIFSIHGAEMVSDRPHPGGWARCLPSEKLAKPAGEWNHYRLLCLDGTMRLEVNGVYVSGGTDMSPRKGYICLESEGSEVHFKDLRILELPAIEPLSPEEVAKSAPPYRNLYSGIDLRGWTTEPGAESHWEAADWVLKSDGQGAALLATARLPSGTLTIDARGEPGSLELLLGSTTHELQTVADRWKRFTFAYPGGTLGIRPTGAPAQVANLFVIESN